MASSDHFTASLIQHWNHIPASFLDPCFPDAFKVSLSSPDSNSNSNSNTSSSDTSLAPDIISSFEIDNVLQGEETVRCAEATLPKQRQKKRGVASGKVTKRKSRATKKFQTTFITTDPASFCQMVQQVTGSSLSQNPTINIGQMMRPELLHRPGSNNGSRSSSSSSSSSEWGEWLPTLDTSALLLDQEDAGGMVGGGGGGEKGGAGLTDYLEGLDSFCFPTLESWNSHVTTTTLTNDNVLYG